MTKTKIAVILLIFIFLIGAFVFLKNLSPTGAFTAKSETIKIGYVPNIGQGLTIIALRKGFFEKEGLQVEEVRASFIGYIFQGLVNNDLDILTGGETPAVFMALQGGNFKIAAQLARAQDFKLVSLSAAKVNSFRALEGKRVGLPVTSVAHYNLWKNLIEAKVDTNKVAIVDTAPQNMASSLEKNEVDAIFLWEPAPTNIEKGLKEKVTSLTPENYWLVNLYYSNKFSQDFQKTEKVKIAFENAAQFIKQNKEEAIEIIAKETNTDTSFLKDNWFKWNYEVKPFTEIELLKQEEQWATQTQLINTTKEVNWTKYTQN